VSTSDSRIFTRARLFLAIGGAITGLLSTPLGVLAVPNSGKHADQRMTVYQCTFGDAVKHTNLELRDPRVEVRKQTEQFTLFIDAIGTASYVSRVTHAPRKLYAVRDGPRSVFVEAAYGAAHFVISVFELDRDALGRTPAIFTTHGWDQLRDGHRLVFSPETSVGYCLVTASNRSTEKPM
jgi:hypothetical protein